GPLRRRGRHRGGPTRLRCRPARHGAADHAVAAAAPPRLAARRRLVCAHRPAPRPTGRTTASRRVAAAVRADAGMGWADDGGVPPPRRPGPGGAGDARGPATRGRTGAAVGAARTRGDVMRYVLLMV